MRKMNEFERIFPRSPATDLCVCVPIINAARQQMEMTTDYIFRWRNITEQLVNVCFFSLARADSAVYFQINI